MSYGRFRVHPIADAFPLIEGDEFEALVADIDANGLNEPIVLAPDGETIVDGRNRWRACDRIELDQKYTTLGPHYTDELIVAYIISTNIRRRHMTTGQRLAVGDAIDEWERGRPNGQGQRSDLTETSAAETAKVVGRSSERTAAQIGVHRRTVEKYRKVKDAAPDLVDKVKTDAVTLEAAYKEAQKRERNRPKPEGDKPTTEIIILRTHEGVEVPYPKPKSKATFNATNEQVSWSAWTWNPVTGCLHGCAYCYARELANLASYRSAYPVGFTPLFHEERLDAPVNTKVPASADGDPRQKRVFVCSMADLYGKWVPDEWICAVHGAEIANPQWDYLHLTKFPSRYLDVDLPSTAWIGTSVDTQRRVVIAEEAFRKIKNVKVKWLSLEPLLEPLAFADLSIFDWVVIGSQSATMQPDGEVPAFAPPFEWVARIVDQAREAGCGIYLKPNLLGNTGPQSPGMQLPQEIPT